MDAFGAEIRRRSTRLDILLLAAVPVALLGVFLLPFPVRRSLSLYYRNPTLVDAYVSNFVHLTVSHLLINLLAYALLASTAYLCFLLAGERERFVVGYLFSLSALPFILSWMNALSTKSMVGFGFSGINMAFLGLLPIGLTSYYREHFAPGLDLDHANVLFFLGALLITGLAVPLRENVLIAVGLSMTGAGIYGYDVIHKVSEVSIRGFCRIYRDDPIGYAELATVGMLVYLGIPFVMFPPAGLGGEGVLNYYTHFLGYSFGFISASATFQLLAKVGDRVIDTK